ncbi:MAG: methionyl-tRNA formyltransferase [Thermodesulfobacteriota bacterium]
MAKRPIEKIVFMGTPGFAVPSLKALIEEGYEIQLVVTQPNRPSGRGRKVSEPPVKELALKEGLEIIQPEHMMDKGLKGRLQVLNPDVIVVVAYGRILPEYLLSIPRFGCINVHSSLLPAYRGAAPINWAIINNEEKTGVTTMVMDAGLDTGPVLLTRETDIEEGETAGELTERLALIGGELLKETLLNFATIEPRVQDDKSVTYARILEKEDGHIDWHKDACVVAALVRGVTPWPGASTVFRGKRIKIHRGASFEGTLKVEGIDHEIDPSGVGPGTIVSIKGGRILVACSTGIYDIIELQMEGKKRMSAPDFLRGAHLKEGDMLV